MTDSPIRDPERNRERGYVLIVFLMFMALLLIATTGIVRQASFEGRRDKEGELIFRGRQYQRAIQLAFRKLGRYPSTMDELEKINGIRFLRKRYRDPMTPDGEWRFIHAANGVLIDSQTASASPQSAETGGASKPPDAGGLQPVPAFTTTQSGQPASQPAFGQGGQPASAASGQFGGQPGQPAGQQTFSQPTDPALMPSANPAMNTQLPNRGGMTGSQPSSGFGSQPATIGTSSQSTIGTLAPMSTPQSITLTQQGSTTSSIISGGTQIAGVASRSDASSIRIFNDYEEYAKWEFIYDVRRDPQMAAKLQQAAQSQAQGQSQQQIQVAQQQIQQLEAQMQQLQQQPARTPGEIQARQQQVTAITQHIQQLRQQMQQLQGQGQP